MLQRTVLKSRKSNPRTFCLRLATTLMKNLPVLALFFAFSMTAAHRVQTKSGSANSSTSGPTVSSGAIHYERFCSGCHGSDGLASDGEAPSLAGSSWVSGSETRLIKIALHGLRGPIQVGDKIYDREMPGLGRRLSDREMAALLSFVRNRWGASGAEITPSAVTRVRTASGSRNRYWTVEELLKAP